ncbi:MAG: hypothetical protein J3K34DRAFT_525414 [Monoraphidium minutum]|nr:MAG: hypothetical protein J3K34DRAFT_525414 [Monoraphidium minutum]
MAARDLAELILELARAPAATLFLVPGWLPLPTLMIDAPAAPGGGGGGGALRVTALAPARELPIDAAARSRLEAEGFGDVSRLQPACRVLALERSLAGAAAFAAAAARWWLHEDALAGIWRHSVPLAGKPMVLVTAGAVRIDAGHIGFRARDLESASTCLLRRTLALNNNAFTLGRLGGAPEALRGAQAAGGEALRALLEMAVSWRGDVEG